MSSVCPCKTHVNLSTFTAVLSSEVRCSQCTYLLCTSAFQQADNWRHCVASNNGIINKHNAFVDYVWHHHSKFHVHCFATRWWLDKSSTNVAVLVEYFFIREFWLYTHTHTHTHTHTTPMLIHTQALPSKQTFHQLIQSNVFKCFLQRLSTVHLSLITRLHLLVPIFTVIWGLPSITS